MEPFQNFTGIVAPLDRSNVDTDAIIPKQFLKSIARTGFGPYLFDELRYLDRGEPGMDCTQPAAEPDLRAERPEIRERADPAGPRELRLRLLARARALGDRRFRAARHHCPELCRHLPQQLLQERSSADRPGAADRRRPLCPCERAEALRIAMDLPGQVLVLDDGTRIAFEVEAGNKERLLKGLDDIGVTLEQADAIRAYEERRRVEAPWLFDTH
jgi:3-isopropylmalate/(R)-2-methylmalate dehydratase small subunit